MNKLKKAMYRIGEQTSKIDWTLNKRVTVTLLAYAFSVISVLKKRRLNPDYAGNKEGALILGTCVIMSLSMLCDWIWVNTELEDSEE